MTNTHKLTLGQAAKEVGISKPSLSAAIKKGRVSAHKNESGVYEIDPAELFRVYPPNMEANSKNLPETNGKSNSKKNGEEGVSLQQNEALALLLAEKDNAIERLEKQLRSKDHEIERWQDALNKAQDTLNSQTRLLEHHSQPPDNNEWEKVTKALEARISNQEKTWKEDREKAQKILRQNKALKRALDEERSKTFWQKLFG